MIKILTFTGALFGAAVFSQFPAFSDQYVQRLAGQVDALTEVVIDFDASALGAGLGREEALAQMTGTPFLTARQGDMRGTFARHAILSDHLAKIRAASDLQRLAMPHRFLDRTVAQAALADFQPALPFSSTGAVAAGLGGLLGAALTSLVASALARPFKRREPRKPPSAQHLRPEPLLRSPTHH